MEDQQRSREDLISELIELRQRNQELESNLNDEISRRQECERQLLAKEALEESEERLQALMNYNPCLVFMKDELGRYVYLNETYEKKFVGSKDWYGKTDFDFWSKESAELFQANDQVVLETGRVTQNFEDSKDLDGTRYCWLNYKFPYTDSKNRRYSGGIGIDVTELILTEEALLNTERRFQALVETNVDFIWEMDAQGRYTYCSPQMEKLWGLKPAEMLGRTPFDLIPPDAKEFALQAFLDYAQSPAGMKGFATTSYDGKGQLIYIETSAVPFFNNDGILQGFRGTTRDTTENKLAQKALAESEQKYRELIETSPAAIYQIDPLKEQFILVNKAVCDLTGFSREELLAMNPVDILDDESKTAFVKRAGDFLKGPHPASNVEYTIIGKDGREISALLNTSFRMDQNGQAICATVIAQDITDRKKAEEKARTEYLITQGINKILNYALFCESDEELGMNCLNVALDITGSSIGFIDEVNPDGCVDCIAISQLGWDACRISAGGGRNLPNGVKVQGLKGRAMLDSKAFFTNTPGSQPDSVGTPIGHPPLNSFIAAPFFENGQVIGMVGLGNKLAGYTDDDLCILEKLTPSIIQALRYRSSRKALMESEAKLRVSAAITLERERLYNVLETLPVMICLLTPDYQVAFANRNFRDRFGEANGRHCHEYCFGYSEPCNFCESYKVLQTGQPHNWEVNLDGTIIDAYDVPFTDVDGSPMILEMDIDITERRRIDQEIARLDRLNLIGEMAASIGHEIRNPMTSVRGFLQMLGSKPEYQDDNVYFELMIEELDRANAIITEYLGMAKDKRIDLQANSLDIIITTLYPMLMSDANLREINIHLDLCNPPQIPFDEREIRQLIINMVRNGMEAMSGKGTLTIGTKFNTDEAVLYIRDEGLGLPPEIAHKIGTPFLTTKENGTGLGLAVCYSIAARHNARIDYETGPSGTTFYIKFPIPN